MAENKVSLPTLQELQATNIKYGLKCDEKKLLEYQASLQGNVDSYNLVDELELPTYPVIDRPYERPNTEDNKFNAWYVRCNIKESDGGKLSGKKIAIKDNTAVAGIPMMNGSKVLEGYVPEYDATVVKRILKEGGEIVGKTTCEDLCFSGGSFYTTYGPVRNPLNPDHTAGGSSSGSGVVVVTGEADMAIGGDQGGSVRIPSSSCGIVGLKPTHGLVPYTGAVPIVPCIDHLGPMTKTVADCALFLEVIAGYDDGFDYRQRPFVTPEYSKEIYPKKKLDRKIKAAILTEGVDISEHNVQEVFNTAVQWLAGNERVELNKVSFPDHLKAGKVIIPVRMSGTLGTMIDNHGIGVAASGLQSHTLAQVMRQGYKAHAPDLIDPVKLLILIGDHVRKNHGTYHYAKSVSLAAHFAEKYNELLAVHDVLIMPTLTKVPEKLPAADACVEEKMDRVLGINSNTSIFNVTGHPALTLNCGFHNGLPVGLMVVGKHFDEVSVLNAASIFEEEFEKHLKV